ncbi:MAG: HTTM domain-containing protein [Alphaproteobacteria bacterium]|nr:HTTM domain-containing protein [Alphaproteobacteria bacterium]
MRVWRAWTALWAEREHPVSLGLVRIGLGLCVLVDALVVRGLGLVHPLFGPELEGGLVGAAPWVESLGPGNVHGVLTLAALGLTVGCFTRTSALILLGVWAQLGVAAPFADRAVDLLARDVLAVLALSGAGAWASVDAAWSTGSLWGDGRPVGAWARRLIVAQLALLYGGAGLTKVDASWWPWGGASALFVVLQDPAVTRTSFAFLRDGGWRLTQVATVVTVVWQLLWPLVVVWMALGWTRFRRLGDRLHAVWLAVGLAFHLTLAATMELGLFPWCMMALYPALIAPRHLRR